MIHPAYLAEMIKRHQAAQGASSTRRPTPRRDS